MLEQRREEVLNSLLSMVIKHLTNQIKKNNNVMHIYANELIQCHIGVSGSSTVKEDKKMCVLK